MKLNFSCDLTPSNILRWLLGIVLVWAALGKLANLQEFFGLLTAYQLPLPLTLLRLIAMVLPWLELLCGLLLLARFRLQAALGWALILFVIFAVCSGQAWVRGLHIACGCLDLRLIGIAPGSNLSASLESVGFAFVRSIFFILAAVYLLRTEARAPEKTPA